MTNESNQSSALTALIMDSDPRIVLSALQDEPAQEIAILIVSLPIQQGATLLRQIPAPTRSEVVSAIAGLEMAKATDVEEILERLEAKIRAAGEGTVLFEEGSSLLAGLLAQMDVMDQEAILQDLAERTPDVSERVRDRLLDFGDLVSLDDESIRLLLDNIELHTLAIALRTAANPVRERFFSIMSEEEVGLLQAEIETLGQEGVLASPQIQRVLVDTIRRFQMQGMIHFRQ